MISVNNLRFRYAKEPLLFEDISFECHAGSVYGLLGLNAAGKTSLMRLLAGLLFPEVGNCTVMGFNTSGRPPALLSECFIVPEQFTLPELSIPAFAALTSPFFPNYSREQFEETLGDWGIDQTARLQRLSLGQQKKVLLAFAFALNTKLLLLDEPTNGLDIPGKSQFRKLLSGLDTENRCVMISTHQIRDLGQTLDRLLILHEGKILLENSIEAISRQWHCTALPASERSKAVYSEPQLGGYRAVVPATAGFDEAEFDLELFFNAAISQPGVITSTPEPSAQTAL